MNKFLKHLVRDIKQGVLTGISLFVTGVAWGLTFVFVFYSSIDE